MNNNQKPRVEFKKGLLKPVDPWAAQFTYEAARMARTHGPLTIRRWKKVDPTDKKTLREHLLENFDVDIYLPHVQRAVDRLMGQWLKDFRCKLHKHYKDIPEGLDKHLYPHVGQAEWIGMCDWFETEEFKKLSTKNTSSKKKQKVPHCCGSKPLVRYREELIDPETRELSGKIFMYHHSHFSKKKVVGFLL